MMKIGEVAAKFFDACETGKGWEACRDYCTPNATFDAQADALVDVKTLENYAGWMKGLLGFVKGAYEIKSFATDEDRNNVTVFAVLNGVHSGDGGPVPATNKSVAAEYVYVMYFDGQKIKHMTKIWNDGWTSKTLGWIN